MRRIQLPLPENLVSHTLFSLFCDPRECQFVNMTFHPKTVNGIDNFRQSNGLTPFRMLCGRDYSGAVVEIGECVLFKKPVAAKLCSQWGKGIWLGKRGASDEHMLGGDFGFALSRTISRRQQEHRWSK